MRPCNDNPPGLSRGILRARAKKITLLLRCPYLNIDRSIFAQKGTFFTCFLDKKGTCKL